jgi:peroxiredoxin
LSNQSTKYQSEFRERVHLPYHLLSDEQGEVQGALGLPTFELHGVTYLKRLTLIIDSGVIIKIHYPVFPSNEDATWAIETLKGI